MMWRSRVSLGLLVVLSLLAPLGESARMMAQKDSLYASLTATQQQFRTEALKAENSLVCGTTAIKYEINKQKDARAVRGIQWGSIEKTASDGMKDIEKNIASLTGEIVELEARLKELQESEKYGGLSPTEIDDMLKAACKAPGLDKNEDSCENARLTSCGWLDDTLEDIPFEEPVNLFRAKAKETLTGYKTLDATTFGNVCAETLPGADCADLCFEFEEIVKEESQHDENLANTETADDVAKKLTDTKAKLDEAQADKSACQKAQTQLKEFANQLGELSSTVQDSTRAVSKFKRNLRMEEKRLARQIIELEKRMAVLKTAKMIFAAASAQVQARQEEVNKMEAALAKLLLALKEQQATIARLRAKLTDIEDATDAGRIFKAELSRMLLNAVSYNTEAVTAPLHGLGLSPDQNIVKNFDDAEAAAAPAMKATVNAVGNYCGSQEVLTALTGVQVDASHKLDHICTGQNWNDMIDEAQATVKEEAKTVVEILVQQQSVANEDKDVPSRADLMLREASGEPKGLRHAKSLLSKNGGTFVTGYVFPGWSVTLQNGNAADVGKMLKLYQKLGEHFEVVTADWEAAKEKERELIEESEKVAAQVEELKVLLQKAIAAQQVAKEHMEKAQGLVDEAERDKTVMEGRVAKATTDKAEGDDAFNAAKDALMSEHKKRSAALLELFQELQQQQ